MAKTQKTKVTPRERAISPTELPSKSRIPEGISPDIFLSNREFLSVIMLRYITNRLRAIYQAYDGDLLLCLVLGEIATRNTENFRLERGEYNHPNMPKPKILPCNALSITDVTGIPRETVRRKINKLLEKGWIEKTPENMYILSDKVGTVFAAFNDSQVFDFLNTASLVEKLLKK